MKVDRNKLIELLARKTSMEPEDVEKHLSDLMERIREAAGRGKALEIKGFGLFYFNREGILTFDPAEELETEINFKYAGMDPVEVRKPRESADTISDSEPEEEEDPEDIFGLEDEESTLPPDKADRDEKPMATIFKEESTFDLESTETEEEPEPEKKSSDEPDPKRSGRKSRKEKVEKGTLEKNSISTIITSILVVILVSVALILAWDNGLFDFLSDDEPYEVVAAQEETETEAQMPTEEPEPVEEESDQTDQAEMETPQSDEEADTGNSSLYGLSGQLAELEGRHYTIVLHSMRQQANAEREQQYLEDRGYRSLILNVDHPEYGAMWRVGIGQFETIQDAQEAAGDLPTDMPDNFFIGLIQ